MKFSKLILPLLLLVTACQPASLPNKSTALTNYGFEQQSKHHYPILDVISDYIVADVENTVVFKGNVELKRDQLVRFLADCISLEYNENGITYGTPGDGS